MHTLSSKVSLIWKLVATIESERSAFNDSLSDRRSGNWLPVAAYMIELFRPTYAELIIKAKLAFDFESLAAVAESEVVRLGMSEFREPSASAAIFETLDRLHEVRTDLANDLDAVFERTRLGELARFIEPRPDGEYYPDWCSRFEATDFWGTIRSRRCCGLSDSVDVQDLGRKAEAEIRHLAANNRAKFDSVERPNLKKQLDVLAKKLRAFAKSPKKCKRFVQDSKLIGRGGGLIKHSLLSVDEQKDLGDLAGSLGGVLSAITLPVECAEQIESVLSSWEQGTPSTSEAATAFGSDLTLSAIKNPAQKSELEVRKERLHVDYCMRLLHGPKLGDLPETVAWVSDECPSDLERINLVIEELETIGTENQWLIKIRKIQRLETAGKSGAPHTGEPMKPTGDATPIPSYSMPDQYERDKWIYENMVKNSCSDTVTKLEKLAVRNDWGIITSRNGLKAAAERFATFHNYNWPVKFKG